MKAERDEGRPRSGDGDWLAVRAAVLEACLVHDTILAADAFQRVADAVARVIAFEQMAVLVREGTEARLFALSRGKPPVVPFGARFPVPDDPEQEQIVASGAVHVCHDMRQGSAIERLAAEAGHRSFALVGIPIEREPPGWARLVVTFGVVGAAASVPRDWLVDLAAMLGRAISRSLAQTRERRLAMILDTSGDAMLAWDHDGRITDVNAAAVALTGRSRAELVGASIRDLLTLPGDATSEQTPSPGALRMELSRRTSPPEGGGGSSSRRVVVSASITEVRDDPKVAAHALLRDKSRVVAAEREAAQHLSRVRELEAQLRTLLDNAPLIIFRLTPDGGALRYLNRHAERLLGVPTDEALATDAFLRRVHAEPDGSAAFDAAVACARRGAVSPPYEARLRWGAGPEIAVRGTVYPLLSEQGEVVAIEGILEDTSAENAARTRLVQADRLSTLGTLAAGVAHEINNPAAFVLLGLDLLDRKLARIVASTEGADDLGLPALVSDLRESVRRIVDITRDLRLFASPGSGAKGAAVVDASRAVESALTLTRSQILERAQIVRLDESGPPVLMDEGRLCQVVVNLLVNAIQAIPKNLERDHAVTVSTKSDGTTVSIEVIDTGVGIAAENLTRIWQPFFTTKSPEVGTGLGLSISREIVERAGGRIDVESPPGGATRGARFVISLPAAGRVESITPMSTPLPRIPGKKARVLVVDDEPSLARALAAELGEVHEVQVAPSGEVALALLGAERFDVILCDLRMPGMSGETLFGRVREADPRHAQAFVFMTGVGFGADLERFLASSGRPVLEKPFATDRALRAIAKVLGETRRP